MNTVLLTARFDEPPGEEYVEGLVRMRLVQQVRPQAFCIANGPVRMSSPGAAILLMICSRLQTLVAAEESFDKKVAQKTKVLTKLDGVDDLSDLAEDSDETDETDEEADMEDEDDEEGNVVATSASYRRTRDDHTPIKPLIEEITVVSTQCSRTFLRLVF